MLTRKFLMLICAAAAATAGLAQSTPQPAASPKTAPQGAQQPAAAGAQSTAATFLRGRSQPRELRRRPVELHGGRVVTPERTQDTSKRNPRPRRLERQPGATQQLDRILERAPRAPALGEPPPGVADVDD